NAFVDPGVAEFGLTNGVFGLGDQFLEVVVPVQEETAVGRFLQRSADRGGYMAIFQSDDLDAVRTRADEQKIRRIWNIDLPDISASHLHPTDIGAGIVSIDEARPTGSWRWGGPEWRAQTVPGGIRGLEVTAIDPQALSVRWGMVFGLAANDIGQGVYDLATTDGPIRFIPGERDHLSAYDLAHPAPKACLDRAHAQGLTCDDTSFLFCGVRIRLKAD
ncbi:MAG: hypothetical protein AAGL11_10870, partial [Pseudomonadota bacterium]